MIWTAFMLAVTGLMIAGVAAPDTHQMRKKFDGYVAKSTFMYIVIVRSKLECVKVCSQNDKCKSVFYMHDKRLCQTHRQIYGLGSAELTPEPSALYYEKAGDASTAVPYANTATKQPTNTRIRSPTTARLRDTSVNRWSSSTTTELPTSATTKPLISPTHVLNSNSLKPVTKSKTSTTRLQTTGSPKLTTKTSPTTTTTDTSVSPIHDCPPGYPNVITLNIPGWTPITFIIFIDKPRTFYDAIAKCFEEGASEYKVTTIQKFMVTRKLLACPAYSSLNFWVDGKYRPGKDAWETTDGHHVIPMTSHFWSSGQPDGNGTTKCVRMDAKLYHLLDDCSCKDTTVSTYTICEKIPV